jgi:archaellum component FlaG (FlaF/FlaG flagellin family)
MRAALMLLLAFAAACRNGVPRARFAPRPSAEQTMLESDSARVSMNTCPLDPSRANPAANRTAALLVLATLEPSPKAGTMATVHITGETSARSAVSIDPAQLARFELAPGSYDVQITLEDYSTVNTRVVLTRGCNLKITPTLRGPSRRR